MAIEHRARVALSITFIASIAAYPNFAPGIFDRIRGLDPRLTRVLKPLLDSMKAVSRRLTEPVR
jgi:hypothetical protein